jgi:hypothetical protein
MPNPIVRDVNGNHVRWDNTLDIQDLEQAFRPGGIGECDACGGMSALFEVSEGFAICAQCAGR